MGFRTLDQSRHGSGWPTHLNQRVVAVDRLITIGTGWSWSSASTINDNSVVVGVLEGAQHSVSANVPEVDAFVCGEPESLRGMGLELRCTGQERNRAMEVIAVASGGGRVEVLEELWKGWGLSAALDVNVGETKSAGTAVTTVPKLSSSSSKWICELIDESKAIWIACKGGHIAVFKKL